jgi:hypothetical protein
MATVINFEDWDGVRNLLEEGYELIGEEDCMSCGGNGQEVNYYGHLGPCTRCKVKFIKY